MPKNSAVLEPLKEVVYTDDVKRSWVVKLPESVPDSEARRGVPVGPPPLTSLELPEEFALRLHGELFARRLITEKDVRSRREDVVGALMAALRIDAQRIIDLYLPEGGV